MCSVWMAGWQGVAASTHLAFLGHTTVANSWLNQMQLDNFQCWMILVRYGMIWVIFGMYDYGYRGFRGFLSHGGTPIAGWFIFHGRFWALGAGASHSWDDHERNRLPKRPSNGLVNFSSSVGMGIWKKTDEIGPKSKLSNMSRVGPWDLLRPKYSSLTRPGFRRNAACATRLHRDFWSCFEHTVKCSQRESI